jgi:hypothetical protein
MSQSRTPPKKYYPSERLHPTTPDNIEYRASDIDRDMLSRLGRKTH